jgi:hypothetical protein
MQFPKHHYQLKGQRAEEYLYDIAVNSFISDWCYLNPKLPDGKELCDLLVVFGDTILIWQIKDLKLNEDGTYNVSEVEKNYRQLIGARRQLLDLKTTISLYNPRRGKESFVADNIKTVYLLAAFFGDPPDFLNFSTTLKDRQIHVLTKSFTKLVLEELDTIHDFIGYLSEKESLSKSKTSMIIIEGGEQELLGWYIQKGNSLKDCSQSDCFILDGTIWDGLITNPKYLEKKRDDEISYLWDSIINTVHTSGSAEYEVVARELAKCTRFERRFLSQTLFNALEISNKNSDKPIFRRFLKCETRAYCFIFTDATLSRENRKKELGLCCFVARGTFKDIKKVIGIATENGELPYRSYDFCYLEQDVWTDQDEVKMTQIQESLSILKNPRPMLAHFDEYRKDAGI